MHLVPSQELEKGKKCRVSLTQPVIFLVVELIHLDLNYRFDMSVVFTPNYFLVRGNALIDSETLLITDFMNLKMKPT
jgi:hypothetical protein